MKSIEDVLQRGVGALQLLHKEERSVDGGAGL